MTTGYTAPLAAGSPLFTFRDFALRCARGIDFASAQRDQSLDVELREESVDPDLISRVTSAAEELQSALNRDQARWTEEWNTHVRRARKEHSDAEHRRERLRQRYVNMLDNVEDWTPPSELHEGLKDFMRQQLIESLEWDCAIVTPAPQEFAGADDYKVHELLRLNDELARRKIELAAHIERVTAQNEWLRTLWASLAAYPHTTTALAAEQEATS